MILYRPIGPECPQKPMPYGGGQHRDQNVEHLQMNLQVLHVLIAVLSATIWHWFLRAFGAYRPVQYHSAARTAATVIGAAALAAVVIFVLLAIGAPTLAHYKWLSTVFGITIAISLMVRLTATLASGATPLGEKRVL